MSKFNIKNINYVSSGPKGTVLNIDFERKPIIKRQRILSEENDKYTVNCEHDNKNIRISDVNDTVEISKQIDRLNNERIFKNKTMVVEIKNSQTWNTMNDIKSSQTTIPITPIYDIKDLNIKYDYAKPLNLDHTQNRYTTDGCLNVYSAEMNTDPIGFINFNQNGNAILLTESTSNEIKSENTTLIDNVKEKKSGTFYSHRIDDITENKKYQYSPLNELSVQNYSEYLRNHNSIELFEPKYELHNIKNNYIYQINNNSNEYSNYENGDIYGNTFRTTKNTLNSLYSMEMTDSNNIKNCREYCGIGMCGEFVFLKFYDNVDYTCNSDPGSRDKQMNSNETGKRYPYQKIEIISQFNNSVAKAKHKANIFSVVLKNTKLNTKTGDESLNALKNKIMKDITNSIKDITRNLCPANTHLFNVEFVD